MAKRCSITEQIKPARFYFLEILLLVRHPGISSVKAVLVTS
jgi:hypothetical protein